MILKVKAGKYMRPLGIEDMGPTLKLTFNYNKTLIAEIKCMEGARWNPEGKFWTVANSRRNWFQFDFMQMKNPYAHYQQPLKPFVPTRTLYDHQIELVQYGLTYHYSIWAAEMGTGKTLAAIELAESVNPKEVWYIGPKSGVKAVDRELSKWNAKITPRMMTYEELVKVMRTWVDGREGPDFIIFDEASKLKTPTAQRSQAAFHLAESVRDEHGMDGYVIEMSGTPAPKTPVDWWHLCEVACPGFLREGNTSKFKQRLCVIEERQSIQGGVYPHIVAWKDDEKRCDICGQYKDHENHALSYQDNWHDFVPGKNEVEYLYRRMKGLVIVKFKKDCLNLPEKQYIVRRIKPTVEILRAVNLITTTATRAIEALTLCRELSDGFQYKEIQLDEVMPCPNCHGKKMETDYETNELMPCSYCGARGEIAKREMVTDKVGSPKDEVLIEYLNASEETGRIIIWGGFTGTLERLVEICHKEKWSTLCVSGKGYIGTDSDGNALDPEDLLSAMDASHPRKQELMEKYPRLAFIGNPKAGGMALTLTASPLAIYYSNDFSGEARMQSEDRHHRAGMDTNRGCMIVDFIMLQSDKLVLDNIMRKKELQALTMGELKAAFEKTLDD